MNLFIKKPIGTLLAECEAHHGLKRSLGARSLVALGIGAIIGAGIFTLTGVAAATHAGPAMVYSFILAALGCAFAGICLEGVLSVLGACSFTRMRPRSGSTETVFFTLARGIAHRAFFAR